VKRDNWLKKTIALITLALILFALTMVPLVPLPSAKAQTSEAQVLSYSWYAAPSNTVLAPSPGDLIVVGEIQNVGSNTISNATVQGIAHSSSGQTLATATGPAFVYEMLPGQKAPFYIDMSAGSTTQNLASQVSSVTVSVASVTNTPARPYTGLTIPSGGTTGFMAANDTYEVVGTIVNTGTQTTGNVWAVITFYNASGTVVSLNYTNYLASSLRPGDATRFIATPVDNTLTLSSQISTYNVVIDSMTSSQSSSTQPTLSPTNPPTNSNQQLPILPIVVVVVIAVAATVALLLLRKRQKPQPPPTQPQKPTDFQI